MKVSLKLREERRPIVRAKLPLNVLGLPVFTGITSGDQEELALHLGTDVQAGPSFRVSYKPNNVFSPFSVLVKTGFGLWGSPNAAALAMSAEFDLNSSGSPSFSVRLKPKFGDFGFQKDSGRFKASYENAARIRGSGDKMIAMDSGEHSKSVDADLTSNGPEVDVHAVSPNGKATANGDLLHGENHVGSDANHVVTDVNHVGTDAEAFVLEKAESFSNGTLEKSESFEKSRDTPEKVKRISDPSPSDDDGVHYEQEAESDRNSGAGAGNRQAEESTSVVVGRQNSRIGAAAKGWRFNAHSSLPLGGWAVAKVRWQVKFGSTFLHDVRQGLHITDIKLPALSVDKLSFETLNRHRTHRSREEADLVGLGFEYDDSSQLGRIAAMCTSMRYQIQLLHLENKFLKSTIDEWRGELPATRRPAGKGAELIMQEETALQSLNGKLNGGSNGNGKSNGSGNGKSREGRFSHGDSQSGPRPSNGKGTTSTGEDFTITKDPSEELQKAILNATGGGH